MARVTRELSPFAGLAAKVVVTLTLVVLLAWDAQAWGGYSQPKCVDNQKVFMSKMETCQTSFKTPLMKFKALYGEPYWKCIGSTALFKCWHRQTVRCPGVEWFDKLLNATGWKSRADFVQFLYTKSGSLCRFGLCPNTKAVYDYERQGCALLANQTVQKQPDATNPECLRWKTFGKCLVKIVGNCGAHYRNGLRVPQQAWLTESLKADGFGSKDDWVTFVESKMASKCREAGACPASKAEFAYESGVCMQQGMEAMGNAAPGNRTCVLQQTSGQCILGVVENCPGVAWYDALERETAREAIAAGVLADDSNPEDFDFIATTKENMENMCSAIAPTAATPAAAPQEPTACPVNETVFNLESMKCYFLAYDAVKKAKPAERNCLFQRTLSDCVIGLVQNCPGVGWYEKLELKTAKTMKASGLRPQDSRNKDFDFIASLKKQADTACSAAPPSHDAPEASTPTSKSA